MALTSLEASVLLSVNQASSIQSWGGRCESITIGHNPYSNPLSSNSIFLERNRPLFLCERVLDMTASPPPPIPPMSKLSKLAPLKRALTGVSENGDTDLPGPTSRDPSVQNTKQTQEKVTPKPQGMSSTSLLGRYSTLKAESKLRNDTWRTNKTSFSGQLLQQRMLQRTEREHDILNFSWSRHRLDTSRNGALNPSERTYGFHFLSLRVKFLRVSNYIILCS
mgnify:CR=1 FL=1